MKRNSMWKFAPVLVLCGLAASAPCQTNDSITLLRAVALAVKNSAVLTAVQQGLSAAQARTGQAKSAWWPSVSGVASYSNIGPEEKMSLDLPAALGGPIGFQLFPMNNWDVHAGADYVLFDFGRRGKAVRLSALGEQAVQTGSGMAAKAVAYQTIVLFESTLGSAQLVAAKQENIANLSRHLDFVKKKLSTGSTTEFDVLRSEVQLANSQTELVNLENDLSKQHIDLRYLLGLPESAPVNCIGAFDSSFREPAADSLVGAALRQRTEIDLLTIGIKALLAQLSLTRVDLAPTLSAHVAAGGKNGYIPDLDEIKFNWVAAAQITAPIFDGRKNHFRQQELRSRIDSLNTVLEDLKRRVRTDVLKAVEDVKSAHQNVSSAASNVRLAAESRRIATLQYAAGVIPNLDLLDAEDKYTQAEFSKVLSEFKYALSTFALLQATGFDFVEWAGANETVVGGR
jgi:outer membrane protein